MNKNEKTKKSKSNPEFLQVGVDEDTMPDELNSSSNLDVPNWDDTEDTDKTKGKTNHTSSSKWGGNATEEMENFRQVPIVGLLPWRVQYIAVSFVFLISLLGLFYFSSLSINFNSQNTQKSNFQSAISIIHAELGAIEKGETLNADNIQSALVAANSSSSQIGGSVASSWKEIESLVQSNIDTETVPTVLASTERLSQSIEGTINELVPLWRSAGDAGEWASVDAVNFSQAFAELRHLLEIVKSVSSGGEIPERLSISRQNIEQSLRMYASSPASATQTNLSRAYNNLAAGFLSFQTDLDVLQGNRQKWNSTIGGLQVFNSSYRSLISSPELSPTPPPSQNPLFIFGSLVLLSLILLVAISLKQHKWRMLQAHSLNEQMHHGIDYLGQQIEDISSGDLTTQIIPPAEIFSPLAKKFNETINSLKTLVTDIKFTTETTKKASDQATQSTGLLVDDSRNQAEHMVKNGNDIINIISAVEKVSSLSTTAHALAHQSVDSVSIGQNAVEKVQSSIQMINEKAEEGITRSRRLHKSSSEISNIVALINEIAEQMSVLSIQAALQAAKAGDAGKGFRVVADGLKSLSEKSGEGARSVGSLVEANIADIISLEETMEMMNNETSEGVNLIDTSIEASLITEQKLSHLKNLVDEIKEELETQEQTAISLSTRTEQGLSDIELTTTKAQDAAESVMKLVEAVRGLNESIVKFKVK